MQMTAFVVGGREGAANDVGFSFGATATHFRLVFFLPFFWVTLATH